MILFFLLLLLFLDIIIKWVHNIVVVVLLLPLVWSFNCLLSLQLSSFLLFSSSSFLVCYCLFLFFLWVSIGLIFFYFFSIFFLFFLILFLCQIILLLVVLSRPQSLLVLFPLYFPSSRLMALCSYIVLYIKVYQHPNLVFP